MSSDANILPFPARETPPMSQLANELRALADELVRDGPTPRCAASLRRIAFWLEREFEDAMALFCGGDSPAARESDEEPPF